MITIKFTKEDFTNRWYAILHEWKGSRDDLEMVCGADTMLDIMSEGNDYVYCTMDTEHFENSDVLELVRPGEESIGGSYYILKHYRGIEINLEIWLCNTTLFVFGEFPNKIYICSYLHNT